jgi:spore coat-associated protein N
MIKNRKLATAAGSVAIVAAAIALTAGTYSYFSDENTNSPGSTTAGTLKVSVDGMNNASTIDVQNIAPGQSVAHRFTVTNDGSLPGKLYLKLNTTDGAADILDNALIGRIYDLTGNRGVAYSNPFSTMTGAAFPTSDAGVLAPGTSKTFQLNLRFPTGTPAHDNVYQATSTGFSVKARLDQDPLPANP